MRIPLIALALGSGALGLSRTPSHDQQRPFARKTLGFGYDLPHAVFHTSPEVIEQPLDQLTTGSVSSFEVARSFVTQLLQKDGQLDESSSFVLRDDSYTDKRTGVSHVYFRQRVNGLDVADGNINVNVKDGIVISYGDSFYRGPAPTGVESPVSASGVSAPWERYCDEFFASYRAAAEALISPYADMLEANPDAFEDIDDEIRSEIQRIGTSFVELNTHHCFGPMFASGALNEMFQRIVNNPKTLPLAKEYGYTPVREADWNDPRDAVLRFMIAASPDATMTEDIAQNYDSYREGIDLSFWTTFIEDGSASTESLLSNVPLAVDGNVKAHHAYVQAPHGSGTVLELVWKIEVEMIDNWYEATITAHSPHKIFSVVDWASDSAIPSPEQVAPIPKKPTRAESAIYNVFQWGVNDPECGNRTIEKEGVDKVASPLGWHSIPAENDPNSDYLASKKDVINNYTTTWGNNVFAHENWEGRNGWQDNYRPDAGPSLVFNYTYNPQVTNSSDALDEAKKYINATVTQLFYTINLIHDLYYRYGFDEVSGNFQQHNFGRGGRENDAIIANAQDGSGYNNANFMTPPDGSNGRCRMYLWNTQIPYRDGDLEAGIVIHEVSHGLSTRLTGGPANSGCLGWGESGGMGEGWGDFLATVIRSTSTYADYPMGAWAANRPTGIRNYIYSLNETVNPSTYKTLDKPGYWGVHAIGEVWAEILWIVAQRLITKHGYSESLFPPLALENGTIPEGDFYRPKEYDQFGKAKPLVPKHGNSLVVQLVLDGMKLQKCMPSFFDARDAIIQADQILTGGENYCDLWIGFAERGLGEDAHVEGRTPWGGGIRTNGHKVPLACRTEVPAPEPVPEPLPGDGDEDQAIFNIF